ncbi:hypothetical protein PsorP6_017901 [Peronosclerospora sorghi]|uniref:Uncharacterized protein n=1 Tax=Peronosclerospora sorghi TaxID=230839 RepID=A0ACC0WED7_9STRA|nr:hypothetical protein PsorP6_017901 [Peronosclerospora sorghi]
MENNISVLPDSPDISIDYLLATIPTRIQRKKPSPEFAEFLRELPPEAYVNRLRRYLNIPVERIPRYKLLLQELVGCTRPEHVDFVPLQSAIQSLDRVANKIKEISEIHENTRTLVSVSAKVGLDLSGRHFVRDGMLHKVCRSKVQLYYFLLLENGK